MRYFSFFILYLYSILLSSAQIVDNNGSIKFEPYKLNLNYIGMLSDRAVFFLNAGNYEKAVNKLQRQSDTYAARTQEHERLNKQYSDKSNALFVKGKNKASLKYANNFSVYLNQINERNIAMQYKNNAIRILNDILGDSSKDLKGNDLPNIYSRYSEDKVTEVFMNAFNEYVYMQYDSIVYAVKLFEEDARPCIEIGDYSNAITTLKETLRLLQKWAGDYYDKYTSSLLLLSICYDIFPY